MDNDIINLQIRRIEKKLPHLSAHLSDAIERATETKSRAIELENLLTYVLGELEELYLSIGPMEEEEL